MPSPAVLYGTGLVSSTVYPYSITIGWTEVAPTGAELESIEFEETGDDDPGYCRMRIFDATSTLPIAEEQVIRVVDNTLGAQVYLGFVLRRSSVQSGPGRYINIEAVSASRMLDEILVPSELRPVESDQARVAYLWGTYARYPLVPDGSLIAQTNAATAADQLVGMTLRTALTQTAGLAGSSTHFHVDSVGRLVWRTGNSVTTAPYNINVATAPGSGNIAPAPLVVTRDGVIKNRYYVRAATVEASGWVSDPDSVMRYGPREDYIDAASADTTDKASTIGRLLLGKTATPNIRAEFTTIDPNSGWRADQLVTITSAADDLAAEVLRIVKVTTKFWRGDGKRSYTISAGKTGGRLSGVGGASAQVNATPGQNISGTISAPNGSTILSTSDDPMTGGFGPSLRRFVASGSYNGDFNATPNNPDSAITDDNGLPFWSFVQASGNKFTAMSQADATTASGRSILMTLRGGDAYDPGAAGDEGYLEQVMPVNGSQGRSFVYLAAATFKTGAVVNGIEVFARTQYLTEDGFTTGTEDVTAYTTTAIGAGTLRDIQSGASDTGAVPTDAYWLRVQVGLRRAAAATIDAVSVTLHEVRLQTGGVQIFVVEGAAPATYGYATIYQYNGTMWVASNQGGTGYGPRMYFDGTTGTVAIQSANGHGVVLSTMDATGNPWLEMYERVAPATGLAADGARLYVQDNGAGKTQLVVKFSTGVVQILATQP